MIYQDENRTYTTLERVLDLIFTIFSFMYCNLDQTKLQHIKENKNVWKRINIRYAQC